MQALTYFAQAIQYAIPHEILQLSLTREANNNYRLPQNIDILIKHRILPRVTTDFDLSRGVSIRVNIQECQVVGYGENFTLLKIPDTILNGRSLISITGFLSSHKIPRIGIDNNARMVDHISGTLHGYGNTNIEVVSNDEFFIYEEYTKLDGVMEVTVGFSKDLNEINPRYYMELSKLAILAAKAYIHNTLIVKLGEGKIYYGQELNVISSIIEEYSDSNTEYMEDMNIRGSKMLFMNDRSTYNDYIKLHATFGT